MGEKSKIINGAFVDQKFVDFQEKIVDLLSSLSEGLVDTKEMGFLDAEEIFYNRILDLSEEAAAAETFPELSEVIEKAKEIEAFLEAWLERQGLNSLEIEWPILPSS